MHRGIRSRKSERRKDEKEWEKLSVMTARQAFRERKNKQKQIEINKSKQLGWGMNECIRVCSGFLRDSIQMREQNPSKM